MWTPRRILLLFAALFGFGAVYAGYARFLGRIDGLPSLPGRYLEFDDKALPELPQVESPTIVRLREAFGENCAEMGAAYPTRLEIREQGIVFAAGMPQIGTEPTRFVRLSPLSVALFAKPKLPHEQVPGEVTEVSTLHGDEGILEFDRPIASDRDMLSGKAKLVGIELRSNPDPHNTDPRNSRIVLTNNQRSADPGRFLVMKTPGPVFYRTADHPDANNPAVPHISTMATVEIVNRDNLPRSLRGQALPVVAVPSDDALPPGTITDMALGLHTAPPTVTADGLKIFMKRREAATPKGKRETGYSGIRELVFNENVLFSLWVDGASGFPGSDPKQPTKVAPGDPPVAMAGLLGGLYDGQVVADKLKAKALLRIRTLGPFRYDVTANIARFDVAPQANPLLPNNVEVMRYLPQGGKDYLVCQRLDITFNGPMAGKQETVKGGPGFKRLDATGSHVLVAAATEQFQAQGTALTYETDTAKRTATTTLRGAPLSAVRSKMVLIAGTPAQSSELKFVTTDPPAGVKAEKQNDITINGSGRIDLFDDATNEKTFTATWLQSLTQARETIDGVGLDLLTFNGDGQFIDAKGQFHLKGDTLKLWLKGSEPGATASKATPFKLQALGNVGSISDDAIVEKTDDLTVMFLETDRPALAAAPPVLVREPTAPGAPLEPVTRVPEKAAKPTPVRMSARKIDVWLHRFTEVDPKAPAKYDLAMAQCYDRVVVTQPPADPKKAAIGLDIRSSGLQLKKLANGHAMTATGTPTEIARVRFENITICGPAVVIDEPSNTVSVAGGGWMKMPSSSDLAGAAVREKSEITVHWQSRMKFVGARGWAEFVGQVQAVQAAAEGLAPVGPTTTRSSVACNEMNVTFDKPLYFNRTKRDPNKPESDPKIQMVECIPASADGDVAGGRHVLYLEETIERATSKRLKAQQIEAKLLEVRVKDDHSHVAATGPGTTRMLSMGSKDAGAPPAIANANPAPAPAANAKADQEMKLTVVHFNGHLDLKDKKGLYQEAVFRETVRVAQVPSDNLHLPVDELSKAPARSIFLKCNDTFTVSLHRSKTPGGEDTRTMEALDGAEVKTDDYIGVGHTISYDGVQLILKGYPSGGMATLYRRQRGLDGQDYKSGNPLIYNTKTGQVSGAQSSGGQFTSPK